MQTTRLVRATAGIVILLGEIEQLILLDLEAFTSWTGDRAASHDDLHEQNIPGRLRDASLVLMTGRLQECDCWTLLTTYRINDVHCPQAPAVDCLLVPCRGSYQQSHFVLLASSTPWNQSPSLSISNAQKTASWPSMDIYPADELDHRQTADVALPAIHYADQTRGMPIASGRYWKETTNHHCDFQLLGRSGRACRSFCSVVLRWVPEQREANSPNGIEAWHLWRQG